MNFAIEHPAVLLGLCGVLIANAYIVWRLDARPIADVIPLFKDAS